MHEREREGKRGRWREWEKGGEGGELLNNYNIRF